jgi:hypothetical protein
LPRRDRGQPPANLPDAANNPGTCNAVMDQETNHQNAPPWRRLRSAASALIRRHRWLPAAGTLASAAGFTLALLLHRGALAALGAAFLLLTSYVWGYATRALSRMDWPVLRHLQRRQYAEVWNSLASSPREARAATSGEQEESGLRRSAAAVHEQHPLGSGCTALAWTNCGGTRSTWFIAPTFWPTWTKWTAGGMCRKRSGCALAAGYSSIT